MHTIWHAGFKYTVGNIIKAPEQIIAHGCNARGKMGKGVALAIRQAWPEAFLTYEREALHGLKLGEVVWAPTDAANASLFEPAPNAPLIAHLITQERYGTDGSRFVSYDAVDTALRRLADRALNDFKTDKVAIPLIGVGYGGGHWGVIREIIQGVYHDYDIQFNIYHPDEDRLKSIIDPN